MTGVQITFWLIKCSFSLTKSYLFILLGETKCFFSHTFSFFLILIHTIFYTPSRPTTSNNTFLLSVCLRAIWWNFCAEPTRTPQSSPYARTSFEPTPSPPKEQETSRYILFHNIRPRFIGKFGFLPHSQFFAKKSKNKPIFSDFYYLFIRHIFAKKKWNFPCNSSWNKSLQTKTWFEWLSNVIAVLSVQNIWYNKNYQPLKCHWFRTLL